MTKAEWQRIFSLNFIQVEATEQMTQNHFAVQESTRAQKLHLSDIYVVEYSCLHSTLRPKT